MLLPLLYLAGCEPGALVIDDDIEEPGSGWWEGTDTGDPDDVPVPDYSEFEDAEMRILSPLSGEFIEVGSDATFEVILRNGELEPIEADTVLWTSDIAPNWDGAGAIFRSDGLPIGEHRITALATLPNGETLRNTVGGVLVQAASAGTYTGLFSLDGVFQGLTFTCNGAAVLEVAPQGREISGSGDCLSSTLGFDLPIEMIFDLEYDPTSDTIFGDAGINLFLFTYDFDTTGSLNPQSGELSIEWGGSVPFLEGVEGSLSAQRLTRETTP